MPSSQAKNGARRPTGPYVNSNPMSARGATACPQTFRGDFHTLIPYRLLNSGGSSVRKHIKFGPDEVVDQGEIRGRRQNALNGAGQGSSLLDLDEISNADSDCTYKCSNAGDIWYPGRINSREAKKVNQESSAPIQKSMNIPPPNCEIQLNGIPKKGWKMIAHPETGRPTRDYFIDDQERNQSDVGLIDDAPEALSREERRETSSSHGEGRRSRAIPMHNSKPRRHKRGVSAQQDTSNSTGIEGCVPAVVTHDASHRKHSGIRNSDLTAPDPHIPKKKRKAKEGSPGRSSTKKPRRTNDRPSDVAESREDEVIRDTDDLVQATIEQRQAQRPEGSAPPATPEGATVPRQDATESYQLQSPVSQATGDLVDKSMYSDSLNDFRERMAQDLEAAGMPSSEVRSATRPYVQEARKWIKKQPTEHNIREIINAVYARYEESREGILRQHRQGEAASANSSTGPELSDHGHTTLEASEGSASTSLGHPVALAEGMLNTASESVSIPPSVTANKDLRAQGISRSESSMDRLGNTARDAGDTSIMQNGLDRGAETVTKVQDISTTSASRLSRTSAFENNGLRSLLAVLGFSANTIDQAASGNMTLSTHGMIQVHVTGLRAALAL